MALPDLIVRYEVRTFSASRSKTIESLIGDPQKEIEKLLGK